MAPQANWRLADPVSRDREYQSSGDWHLSSNVSLPIMATIANLSEVPSRSFHAATGAASQGIMTQIHIAARNPLPAVIGALLGALVPSATFVVGHYELTSRTEPKALIVLGGLVFSALTVFRWGRLAFGSAVKALGFVVLAEGVMTFCSTAWLSVVALGYLVLINAIATGCTIALGAVEDQRAAAPTAEPVAAPAADGNAHVMAALASLESRLAARETAPLVLQPTKGARKRIRKPNTRKLHIIPENSEGADGAGGPASAVAAVA